MSVVDGALIGGAVGLVLACILVFAIYWKKSGGYNQH
jgi:hypothetical protein